MEIDADFLRTADEANTQPENSLPFDLIEELDQALEKIMVDTTEMAAGPEPQEPIPDGLSTDVPIREMQLLFLDMARHTLGPVGRYMKAMSLGDGGQELLELSELVVTPFIPKVEAVGLSEHAEDLAFFRSLLLLALGEREHAGSKAIKEVVMEGFKKVGERFGLSYRGYRLAVRNVVEFYRSLRECDSISEADIRRFFAIGVPSLTWVRRTKVSELTSLSGVPMDVMTQIRRLAYEYRSQPRVAGASLVRDEFQPRASSVAGETPEDVQLTDVQDSAVFEHADIIRGEA